MEEKKLLYREIGIMAIGEVVGGSVMFGVFALLGKLDGGVLLGGAVGVVLAVANYFFMAVGVDKAASKAEAGNPAGGQVVIRISMLVRYLILAAALIVAAKSGRVNIIALLVPLVLSRPILAVGEFFRKSGEKQG